MGTTLLIFMGTLQVSEGMFRLAVAWWLLTVSGSATLFASVIAFTSLAMFATNLLLGWVGDSYSRVAVLAACYGLDAVTCAALLGIALMGGTQFELIAILLTIGTVIASLAGPVHSTLGLEGADSQEMKRFIRHRTTIGSISMIGAPILGGALVSLVGWACLIGMHLGVNLLLFIVILIVFHSHKGLPQTQSSVKRLGKMQLVFSGIAALLKIPVERSLCVQSLLANVGLYPLMVVVLPVLVKDILKEPPVVLGVADSFFGLGMLIFSAYASKRILLAVGKFKTALLGRILSIIGLGTLWFAILLNQSQYDRMLVLWFGGLSLFALGGGFSLVNISVSQARLSATPDQFRNRLMSASGAIVTLGIPVGSFLSGAVLSTWGVAAALACVLILFLAASTLLAFNGPTRILLNTEDEELAGAYQAYIN